MLDHLDTCISRLGEQRVGREVDGRTVVFPWGLVGRGYVIGDAGQADRVRRLLNREHVLLIPAVILAALVLGWRAGLAAAVLALVAHAVAVAAIFRRGEAERVERTVVQALGQVAHGRWRGGLCLKALAAAAVAVYAGGLAWAGLMPLGIAMAAGFGLVAAIHLGAIAVTARGR